VDLERFKKSRNTIYLLRWLKVGLRESGLLEVTILKAKQDIQETQQDAESGLMEECFL
jgi:hypothetical protein